MYKNLTYSNELGGISATRISDNRRVYFDPGSAEHSKATAGDWGSISPFEPLVVDADAQKELERQAQSSEVRAQRDRLLADTDWIVTKAIEQNAQDGLGVQIPVVWLDYRQALRDIPQQPGFPDNVTWPTAP